MIWATVFNSNKLSGAFHSWLFIFATLNCIMLLDTKDKWGDVQLFPPNKIPDSALSPTRAIVKRKIVTYHNFFRTKVQPTARNMLFMTWHAGAARQAQRYADKCIFLKHNPPAERSDSILGKCGQNLFVSSDKAPWFHVMKSWFLEYRNFTYGSPKYNLHEIGHYTQMVWATTHKVGCGLALCKGGPWGKYYNYVCHYCPTGNFDGKIQFPYKPGKPCDDCKEHCKAGKLCTNSCPVVDVFNNCDQLINQLPEYCQLGQCNATCYCNDKIH